MMGLFFMIFQSQQSAKHKLGITSFYDKPAAPRRSQLAGEGIDAVSGQTAPPESPASQLLWGLWCVRGAAA